MHTLLEFQDMARDGGPGVSSLWAQLEKEMKSDTISATRTPLLHKLNFRDSGVKRTTDTSMLRYDFLEAAQVALEAHATLAAVQSITPSEYFRKHLRDECEELGVIPEGPKTFPFRSGAGYESRPVSGPGERHCLELMDLALRKYRDSIQLDGVAPDSITILEAIRDDARLVMGFQKSRTGQTSEQRKDALMTARDSSRAEDLPKAIQTIASEGLGEAAVTLDRERAEELFNTSARDAKNKRLLEGRVQKTRTTSFEIANQLGRRGSCKATPLQIYTALLLQSLEKLTTDATADLGESVKKLPSLQISEEMDAKLQELYPPPTE